MNYLICTFLLLTAVSCANADDAEPFANEFYIAMQNGNYKEVMELFDVSLIETQGKENLKEFITQKEALGELKSFSKESDYKIMETDGKPLVRFMYKVEYTDKILYEYLVLVKRDSQYFIHNYAYYDSKEKREEFAEYNETF